MFSVDLKVIMLLYRIQSHSVQRSNYIDDDGASSYTSPSKAMYIERLKK